VNPLLEALLRTALPNKREIPEILASFPEYTDEHLLHARLRDRRFPFKVNSRLPVPAIAQMGKIFELALHHADPSRRASCYCQLFVMAPDCAGMYLDRAAVDRHPIVRRMAAELLSSCHDSHAHALHWLEGFLRDDAWIVRWQAMHSLAHLNAYINHPHLRERLEGIMQRDPDRTIRAEAKYLLSTGPGLEDAGHKLDGGPR
jgi:hypothetical protein